MALVSGSASITRFAVASQPEEPDFESRRFTEIEPGASIRERIGVLPYEPEAPFRVGQHRLFFRVRIDQVKPDPTAVQERLKVLIKAETEATGRPTVSSRRRRDLRHEAEEELMPRSTPRSKVVECCLDGDTLYVGSTANNVLGRILGLLVELGIVCDFKPPWAAFGDDDVSSAVVQPKGPGESVLGCRFLRALLKDPEVMAEPESGSVRLATDSARISLTGAVQNELLHYLERGAEVLAAKLVIGHHRFRLDGLRYRIGSLSIETDSYDSWIELLDERLEHIEEVYDLLDEKYEELRTKLA